MTREKPAWQGICAVVLTIAFFICWAVIGLAEDQPTLVSLGKRVLVILAVLAIGSIALFTSDSQIEALGG